MHHGFATALRRGTEKIISEKDRSTAFAIRRHNGEFHNGNRPHGLYDSQTGMTGDAMGDLVNLKQFKKRAARDRSEQEAAGNRARFGRTRSERALDELQARRDRDLLDQRRIDGEDAS
jgi:hypothetical protein